MRENASASGKKVNVFLANISEGYIKWRLKTSTIYISTTVAFNFIVWATTISSSYQKSFIRLILTLRCYIHAIYIQLISNHLFLSMHGLFGHSLDKERFQVSL